jgi:hypothetical protein
MATTTNYGWTTPNDTDLVKDGAAAIRTLGSSIDTTTKNLNPQTTTGALAYRSATANVNTALPIGTAGQILAVSGGVPAWINNDQGDITEVQAGVGISVASGTGPIPVITNSSTDLITTAGDLLYGTAADTVARLGIGTAGQVLKVNSGATAPEWGAAAAGFIGCSVYKSGTQSLANDTVVVVTWDSEYYDTDAIHSTASNTSRFTVPTGLGGKWQIICSLSFAAATAGSYRSLRLRKNGTDINFFDGAPAGSTSQTSISYSNILDLVATDYIEVTADQNSGGTINLSGGTGRSFLNFTKVG